MFDGEGRYVDVVAGRSELLVDKRAEMAGRSLAEIMPAEIGEPAMDLLRLAVAHSIVSQHGGTIHIDSHRGVGSVVAVCLPATEASEEP